MYSRWSRPQTLSVLDCQANTTRQEQRSRSLRESRASSFRANRRLRSYRAPAADIAVWFSSRNSDSRLTRGSMQSLDCDSTVVDRRCRYYRSRWIDAKHCRLRKVDSRLGKHELTRSAARSIMEAQDFSFQRLLGKISRRRNGFVVWSSYRIAHSRVGFSRDIFHIRSSIEI